MKVAIYRAMGADAPKGAGYIGQIYTPKGDRLPVIFSADEPSAVDAAAQAHWDSELAKAKRKATPRPKKKAAEPEGQDDAEEFV